MKLDKAIEIAKECGLKTYREAILNIDYHAMNIFVYEEIENELKELIEDFNSLKKGIDEEF